MFKHLPPNLLDQAFVSQACSCIGTHKGNLPHRLATSAIACGSCSKSNPAPCANRSIASSLVMSASLISSLFFSKPLIRVDTRSFDGVVVSITSKHFACCLSPYSIGYKLERQERAIKCVYSQQSSKTMSKVFEMHTSDRHLCCSSTECLC